MDDVISRQVVIDAVQSIERLATLPDNDAVVRMSAVEYVLLHLPSAEPEPQWIPCSKKLPEKYGNYLATMDDGDVQECTYSPEKNTPFMRGGWSTCEADGIVYLNIAEVIAWTPLPEAYKGGGRDDDND